MSSEIKQWFASLPFTTKWLTVFSLIFPLLMKFQIIGPHWLVWHWPSITGKFQIWRCFTAPFLTGVNFNFILSLYFRYQYSFYLETGIFDKRPADYFYFVTLAILLLNCLNSFVGMAALWEPLSMSIVYLWSQHHRDVIVNFMFGFKFPAKYLPFVLFIYEFLLTADYWGPLLGILTGHLYYFLSVVWAARDPKWRTRLQAPRFLQRIIPQPVLMAGSSGQGFTVKRPDEAFSGAASQADTSSFKVFSGKGQKLGQ